MSASSIFEQVSNRPGEGVARSRGVERAREHYERSALLEDLGDPACRPVLEAMTLIYRSILEKIAVNPDAAVYSPT